MVLSKCDSKQQSRRGLQQCLERATTGCPALVTVTAGESSKPAAIAAQTTMPAGWLLHTRLSQLTTSISLHICSSSLSNTHTYNIHSLTKGAWVACARQPEGTEVQQASTSISTRNNRAPYRTTPGPNHATSHALPKPSTSKSVRVVSVGRSPSSHTDTTDTPTPPPCPSPLTTHTIPAQKQQKRCAQQCQQHTH